MRKWKYILTWIVLSSIADRVPPMGPGDSFHIDNRLERDTIVLLMGNRDSAYHFYGELKKRSFMFAMYDQYLTEARLDSILVDSLPNP